ncbi:MAG: phosphate acyltransferase PlsX [Planctomycetota bacterium]|nr:phosphate acyltransferase PlsX [Planctomycetota bacterium]
MPVSIAIDAMGGDRAPGEVVQGAVRAARAMQDLQLHLVGIEETVRAELEISDWSGDNIEVVPAKRVIGMGDSPVEALRRKRGSSIEEAIKLVRDGKSGAFLSAGNTGACVAACQLFLGLLPGVKRAGILVSISTGEKPICVVDVGANIEAKPEHLVQYGVMASLYASEILEVDNPRIGLLNIGEEDEKGNRLVKLTRGLFEETDLNFVGNVEGAEVFRGTCDVVICDGFTGNIVLKVTEGLAERLLYLFGNILEDAVKEVEGAADNASAQEPGPVARILPELLTRLERKLDYSEYGGAPLLGVDGIAVIAHGRSDSKAIFNAIRVAKRMIDVNMNRHITERMERMLD